MNWRRDELSHFDDKITWLSEAEAQGAYDQAIAYASRTRYGLDSSKLQQLERLDVDGDPPHADRWLIERMGETPVRVVFERNEVCRMSSSFFAGNWRDMLLPARDDALVVPDHNRWVLFYSHEDEFEFGRLSAV